MKTTILEDEDNIDFLTVDKLPASNIRVDGTVLVDLSNYSQDRVAVGDTSLNIDLSKSANQISGTASNFVVADVNGTGTIADKDAEMSVEQIVFTTSGMLSASGTLGADSVAEFGYDGQLQVLESGAYFDTVTINSDGIGGFMSAGGTRMFLGVLYSDVTAAREPQLNVVDGTTIVWAK